MAQSYDVRPGTEIVLDDYDLAFIAQAQPYGIPPGSALRARYTALLANQPPDGGDVCFPIAGRVGQKDVRIERMYLSELLAKLRSLHLHETARRGLREFNRQDAANFLKWGKLVLDYQVRRVPETRDIDWDAYGGDIDQMIDRLDLKPQVRACWSKTRERIKADVWTGIHWAGGRHYPGSDLEDIFRRVLGYVLLSGYTRDKTNAGRIVLQLQSWVQFEARKQADMEMRKRQRRESAG